MDADCFSCMLPIVIRVQDIDLDAIYSNLDPILLQVFIFKEIKNKRSFSSF